MVKNEAVGVRIRSKYSTEPEIFISCMERCRMIGVNTSGARWDGESVVMVKEDG